MGVRTAIDTFAKMDGIFLDPVYTGKAGLALMRKAINGDIKSKENTVFWHTGLIIPPMNMRGYYIP